MRTYVVLREEDGSFRLLNGVEANSAEQACRMAADDLDNGALEAGVVLYAVPTRNWQPVELKAKTERRLVRS